MIGVRVNLPQRIRDIFGEKSQLEVLLTGSSLWGLPRLGVVDKRDIEVSASQLESHNQEEDLKYTFKINTLPSE